MLNLRALYVFLWSFFLTPALALAQDVARPIEPYGPGPYETTRWGAGWLWLAVLAVVIVALVAWGMSRGRYRSGPPATP
jgi:hypothetical protein